MYKINRKFPKLITLTLTLLMWPEMVGCTHVQVQTCCSSWLTCSITDLFKTKRINAAICKTRKKRNGAHPKDHLSGLKFRLWFLNMNHRLKFTSQPSVAKPFSDKGQRYNLDVALTDNERVWPRPALLVECHEMTFIINWHSKNKTDLTWLLNHVFRDNHLWLESKSSHTWLCTTHFTRG